MTALAEAGDELAVGLGARAGDEPLGDFALHHHDRLADDGAGVDQGEEDGAGDVVRQVADDRERRAEVGREGAEVGVEHVEVAHVEGGERRAQVLDGPAAPARTRSPATPTRA